MCQLWWRRVFIRRNPHQIILSFPPKTTATWMEFVFVLKSFIIVNMFHVSLIYWGCCAAFNCILSTLTHLMWLLCLCRILLILGYPLSQMAFIILWEFLIYSEFAATNSMKCGRIIVPLLPSSSLNNRKHLGWRLTHFPIFTFSTASDSDFCLPLSHQIWVQLDPSFDCVLSQISQIGSKNLLSSNF